MTITFGTGTSFSEREISVINKLLNDGYSIKEVADIFDSRPYFINKAITLHERSKLPNSEGPNLCEEIPLPSSVDGNNFHLCVLGMDTDTFWNS